ncbi:MULTISPECIES: acyl-CoA dehydrogenase family protein [Burkholderiaceae]|uniref:acyl-CoA dehydrogenase family protein n=1 Tax=Burkholderiaceae TaxID=119060 RepID=UPI0009FABA09|nr:acyl-CoA dehydrogenase family protein [Burkholderia sp. b14]
MTHARTRRQFGQPIGKNQAISHRLADMKVNLDAACELVYRVGRLKDAGLVVALNAPAHCGNANRTCPRAERSAAPR